MSPELIEFFNVVLRFTHIVAAIMWIGNSLLFTWMEINLIKDPNDKQSLGCMNMLHAGGVFFLDKRIIDPKNIPDKLHVFKWQSYTTWISGALLLILTFYVRSGTLLLDPSKTDMSGTQAWLISLLSIVGAWVVYDLVWHSPLKHKPTAAISVLTLGLIGYTYWIDGFYNGRFVLLQIGAMIGTTMSANVRFVIIPNQKQIMTALLQGKPHDLEKGRQAKLRSLTNHYVTFPVIFLMLSAHFPMIYGDAYYIPIVFVICIALVVIKYLINIYNIFSDWLFASLATFILGLGIVIMLFYIPRKLQGNQSRLTVNRSPAAIEGEALFSRKGCIACHQPANTTIAPSLHGIYATERRLASGESVLADEAYLRESILNATAKVSYGFAPAMPGYEGSFSEQEVDQLIAYIRSLQ
ncbi:MAG: urate hydroxylase PuuD [Verrucomicrobiota bacterium]